MKEFAAYSFNKSHSVAYSILSFWCMYLKLNYPAPFLAAYMSCAKKEEQVFAAIREAKRLKVAVRQPDINISSDVYEYDPEDNAIVAPIQTIKGVGIKAAQCILEAREKGVFLSVDDCKDRVYKRVVHKGVFEKLIMAGAFESLGVKEPDEELREKQMAELLPVFDSTPTLNLVRTEHVDHVNLKKIHTEIESYCEHVNKQPLRPLYGRSPSLMIINGQMKGETKPGYAKGTKPLVDRLVKMNIPRNSLYYTTPHAHFDAIVIPVGDKELFPLRNGAEYASQMYSKQQA
jgi:DNA polymerase III alpha subunit